MKTIRNKTATIILLAVLAFAFAGCGRDANIEEAVPAEGDASDEETPKEQA